MIETLVTHSVDKKMMAKVTKWLGQALSDTAFDGQAYAVKTLIAHDNVDTGFLMDNINVDLTRIPKGETRVYTQVPYAPPVEFGAGPSGEQPTGGWWPPEAPIKAWVARKLGKTGKDLDKTTWAIRNAIHKRGLVPAPFMRPAADHMRKQLAIYAERAIGRAFKEETGPLTVISKEVH
jgi:hypothetical protein